MDFRDTNNDNGQIDVDDLVKDFKILSVSNLSAYLKELWKVNFIINIYN